MSGTASDPIDLDTLDVAISASDRPDSSLDERLRARRAFAAKLKHLESGVESPEATVQLASALLTEWGQMFGTYARMGRPGVT